MTAILPSKRWQHLSASLLLSACLALSSTTVLAQTTPTNPAITGSFAAPVAKPLADGKPGFWVAPATIPLSATITAASGNNITEVQFYADSTLIATMTAPAETDGNTYKTSWQSVAANSYTLSVKAKDDKGNTYSSAPVNLNVITNAAPQISFTVSPNSATAPATLILSAKASDTDGSISQVEFYNGTTKLTSQTQPASDGNYRYNWSNVGAGNYNLSAKATDNLGTSTSSAVQTVKVASGQAQLYDIHSDQLGTPRLITDASGQEVWRWDSAPFGETAPNENPNGKGKFEFNLRFPGQYYDKETGLHYNYFRDYDPQTGRYVQSDPIGLGGGINTYGYVEGSPVAFKDAVGLRSKSNWKDRPMDPNGEGCKNLEKTITNLWSEYQRQVTNLANNPGNLTYWARGFSGPGGAWKDSIWGHEQLREQYYQQWKARKAEFEKRCTGGDDPPLPPPNAPTTQCDENNNCKQKVPKVVQDPVSGVALLIFVCLWLITPQW